MSNKKTSTIQSYFGFGEHWLELPEYEKAIPVGTKKWRDLKEGFYDNYSYSKPLLMDIVKNDGTTISMYLCGFKIPEPPLVCSLGCDATIGRVALCKLITTGEHIAIHW